MSEKIISKAFECTSVDWFYIDTGFKAGLGEYYSEIVYAETRSKARYKFFLNQEYDYNNHEEKGKLLTAIKVRRKPEMDLVENEPHELAAQITKEMYDMAFHAIGNQALLNPYRNRYVCDLNEDWEKMIQLDIADKMPFEQGVCNHLYFLTELGIKVIVSMQPIQRATKQFLNKKQTVC